jgi:hypothetical protein
LKKSKDTPDKNKNKAGRKKEEKFVISDDLKKKVIHLFIFLNFTRLLIIFQRYIIWVSIYQLG